MPSNDNTVTSILQPAQFLFYYLFSLQERLGIQRRRTEYEALSLSF